jgi:serine/threonine-protein kinase
MQAELSPGDVVAHRYRVERRLAGGGMGIVYVAEHVETEQKVALKVLIPDVAGSHEALERFRLEARVFARLSSDHIVRVLDAGIDDERKLGFIAMELLDGETLHERVARTGPLDAAELVLLFVQIASALDRAHAYVDRDGAARPIVHRDLKPENVFITLSGGALHAKLLDFGIAKVASATAAVSTELRGTPQYMAPEQIEGEAVTPRTDVAALGHIAFFCLTGKSYWKTANEHGATLVQLVREIVKGTSVGASERAKELGAAVPSAIDAWFARATATDPSDRFASAGEAALALAAALGVEAKLPEAPVATPASRAAAPTRSRDVVAEFASTVASSRRPRAAMVVVAAVAALGVIAVVLAMRPSQRTATAPSASTPSSASGGPVAVPLPTEGKPEAITAFADARAALRDANLARFHEELEHAARLDPLLGAARVHAAVGQLYDGVIETHEARAHLAAVAPRRDALSARDRALFDAAERLLAVEPPDAEAFVASLRPSVEASPRDVELLAIFAKALQAAGHLDESLVFVDRVLGLDSGFAFVYVVRADVAWSRGDYEARLRAFDECADRFPRALLCILGRTYAGVERGRADCLADARRVVAIEPTYPIGYEMMTEALTSLDREERDVRTTFDQVVARMPERRAERVRIFRAQVAFAFGHFDEASEQAQTFVDRNPTDLVYGPVARMILLDAAEESRDPRAAQIATDVLAHNKLWGWEWTGFRSRLLVAALRVHALDRARFEREVAEYRAELPDMLRKSPYFRESNDRVRFWLWMDAYARSSASDADAVEAMRRFAEEKLAVVPMVLQHDYGMGEVLLRAGRPAEARASLTRAAFSCHPFQDDIAMRDWARASLLLGRALEATGDASGACAAYARVVARWGGAKRSVTAEEARAAAKKLGCAHADPAR